MSKVEKLEFYIERGVGIFLVIEGVWVSKDIVSRVLG